MVILQKAEESPNCNGQPSSVNVESLKDSDSHNYFQQIEDGVGITRFVLEKKEMQKAR